MEVKEEQETEVNENINNQTENKQTEKKPEEKQPMSKKKAISLILTIILCTVVVLVILFNFSDFNATWELIRTVDGANMGWAVFCLVIYLLLYPLSLVLLCRVNKLEATLLDAYFIGGTEFFFNGITPFSTGGQPVQIYLFTKRGVSAGKATGINLVNFIALMIASNAFAIASLFFYGKFTENIADGLKWMIILGFVMNLFTLVFMILMSTCKWMRDFFKNILLLLCKIKFIGKFLNKAVEPFEKYCENAQLAAKEIFARPLTFAGSVLLKMISLVPYYALPYFILKALGVSVGFENIWLIILASSFAITAMVWVPTPGGTGGIEFAFKYIFMTFIISQGVDVDAVANTGMIIWRFLTYYMLMILSFIMYVIFKAKKGRSEKTDD